MAVSAPPWGEKKTSTVPVAGIGCAGEGEGRARKRKRARVASRRMVRSAPGERFRVLKKTGHLISVRLSPMSSGHR